MKQFINSFSKCTLLFSVLLLGVQTKSKSCSTPVFRYALEMWPAYSYIIEIDHYNDFNDSQLQALALLKNAALSEAPLNITIVENLTDRIQEEPMMKILFPIQHGIPGVIWQGPLTVENVNKIVDSPSRKAALQLLQKGDAAVWLFLESGDAIKDDKQYGILKDELKHLSKTLKLSETATDVEGNPLDIKVINTGVRFSSVRINRNDPLEEIFISILLKTEPDLLYFEKAPLAFPMFGQGRILYALVGNGISSKNIEKACSSIIGWCSCTIKDDNPGVDLLFGANWADIIGDSSWIQPEQLPDFTGIADFIAEDVVAEKLKETVEVSTNANATNTNTIPEQDASYDNIEASKQKDETMEIALEPVQISNNFLQNPATEEKQQQGMSPLLRNSMLMFFLMLAIIAITLFILKRR